MRLAFRLSKEHIDVASQEVLALVGEASASSRHRMVDELLIVEAPRSPRLINHLAGRLAFTRAIYEVLFTCKRNNLLKKIKTFPWNRHFSKDFKLEVRHGKQDSQKRLAGLIFERIKGAKVELRKPTTLFELFFSKDRVVALVRREVIRESYEERKAHRRPRPHPSSMHPRWARALVNLTGVRSGRILDPMCGAGGFLIEAGLMGLRPVGYDIDPVMLERAGENLKAYGVKEFTLRRCDATRANQKFNHIVTDLPYGRNTKKQDLAQLYLSFFKNVKRILKRRAVIVGPHFMDCASLLRQSGLKVRKEFSQYIHHTLTRKIVVVEP